MGGSAGEQDIEHVTTLSGDGAIARWEQRKSELLYPLLHTHLETEEMKGLADGSRFYLGSTGPLALAVTPAQGDWAADGVRKLPTAA